MMDHMRVRTGETLFPPQRHKNARRNVKKIQNATIGHGTSEFVQNYDAIRY